MFDRLKNGLTSGLRHAGNYTITKVTQACSYAVETGRKVKAWATGVVDTVGATAIGGGAAAAGALGFGTATVRADDPPKIPAMIDLKPYTDELTTKLGANIGLAIGLAFAILVVMVGIAFVFYFAKRK